MNVSKISLKNYRNFKEEVFSPKGGINIIYGDNAQGKTNLLEAIWLFTGGRSFRGSKDQELVKFDELYAELAMDFRSKKREQCAEIRIQDKKRKVSLNGIEKTSAAALVGNFCAVVFSPCHLSLVKDGPLQRRKFIDSSICQIKPSYCKTLSVYNHIINQRNTLLKDIRHYPDLLDTLEIWDQRLSDYGAVLLKERNDYCKLLKEEAQKVYSGIADGKEVLSLSYKSNFKEIDDLCLRDIKEGLLQSLKKQRQIDLNLGFTSVGPHRDDLNLEIDGKLLRAFASQGQQRSCVLALKIAEAIILMDKIGEKPIILLDDVMSELDRKRQKYLMDVIKDFQVFISLCEPSSVVFDEEFEKFKVEKGKIYS